MHVTFQVYVPYKCQVNQLKPEIQTLILTLATLHAFNEMI